VIVDNARLTAIICHYIDSRACRSLVEGNDISAAIILTHAAECMLACADQILAAMFGARIIIVDDIAHLR